MKSKLVILIIGMGLMLWPGIGRTQAIGYTIKGEPVYGYSGQENHDPRLSIGHTLDGQPVYAHPPQEKSDPRLSIGQTADGFPVYGYPGQEKSNEDQLSGR